MLRIKQFLALGGILGLGALSFVKSNSSENAEPVPMEDRSEIVGVDIHDLTAMAKWARGLCHGQSVEHLAAIYEIEPTIDSVVAELSKGYPGATRRVVAKACEEELRASDGSHPAS